MLTRVVCSVILDEAQVIKNKSTRAALACCSIEATHRWCLSATPIQNNITELCVFFLGCLRLGFSGLFTCALTSLCENRYSLIKFLRIKPYCKWENFRDKIDNPMKNGKHRVAIERVQIVLKGELADLLPNSSLLVAICLKAHEFLFNLHTKPSSCVARRGI